MKASCCYFALIFSCLYLSGSQANAQPDIWLDRLKGQLVTLDSADLAGDGNVRIASKAVGRDFQVLGIGEQSHGTSEFFAARLLLIKALSADHTLTKIGLEAPMAEVEKLNDYLRDGNGDLKGILRSFRLYSYECQEFVDLVESVGRIGKARGKHLRFLVLICKARFSHCKICANPA